MSEKEKAIQKYMKSLDISREEAEQLWEDDKEDFIGEEGEAMTEKAKEIKRYEKADKPTTKKERPKKIDAEKVEIIKSIAKNINRCVFEDSREIEDVKIVNEQKEITFRIGDSEYSVSLTKHRPPKK